MLYNVDDEHVKYVERFLEALTTADSINGVVFLIKDEDDNIISSYENCNINDLILMNGHLQLCIQRRYLEQNYPSVINEETRTEED